MMSLLMNTSSTRFYMASLLALFTVPSFLIGLATSSSNFTDQLALLAFKSAIKLDPNNVLGSNWTENSNFCHWFGVSCSSPQTQRVTNLRLPNMGLQGTISSHVGNLSFLVELDLINNSFGGYLPPEFSRLTRLVTLQLRFNQLEGEIPKGITHCQNLQVISFYGNNLTGGIPIELTNLTFLQGLYLGSNNLTGPIPPSFGNVSTLEWFGGERNHISGNIPSEFANLPNLKGLNFELNHLTGSIPPAIFNISSLQDVLFAANALSGTLPSTTGLWVPNLTKLSVDGNQLTGEIPLYLSNCSQLFALVLTNNNFTGSIPTNLGQLQLLVRFNLAGNQLTREPGSSELTFLTAMTNCSSLQYLLIDGNPLGGVLPDSSWNFSTSLQWFFASSCQIEGPIPRGIGSLQVNFLLLTNNKLHGAIPSTIAGMQRLQRLYLDGNALEGSIPDEICALRNLGEINLSNNKLAGSIPRCIGNLSSLQRLFLDSNTLNSPLPSSLWSLESLLFLRLSSNLLVKIEDSNIRPLKSLEFMDLSRNQISSEIPSIIGFFQSLNTLDLSGNSFWGPIPESFGNLITLDFLDLSNNSISGTIPKTLEALSRLKNLNLSFNKLTGEIPSGGPFKNFTLISFLGNEALCGQPNLQVPRCTNHTARKSWRKIVIGCTLLVIALVVIFVFVFFMLKRYKRTNVQFPNFTGFLTSIDQRMLSYRELCHATSNFCEANLLGVGSSGSVYKGILSNGTIIAVKILNLQLEGAFKSFDAECKVLRTVRHRNLVKVITTCSNPELRALIMQYMSSGSLEKWLYSPNYSLNLLQRVSIMLDVALALEYLHYGLSEPVVHCDLKPSNVLLDEDMVAHVGDFGIAKILAENQTVTQTKTLGTLGYIAPEYGSEGRVSTRGDIYSYGVMLLETFSRKKPTDEMFAGELTLRQWVSTSIPNDVAKVVDCGLLTERESSGKNQIEGYLLALVKLGLQCSAELPNERSDIKDVVVQLNKIKLELSFSGHA